MKRLLWYQEEYSASESKGFLRDTFDFMVCYWCSHYNCLHIFLKCRSLLSQEIWDTYCGLYVMLNQAKTLLSSLRHATWRDDSSDWPGLLALRAPGEDTGVKEPELEKHWSCRRALIYSQDWAKRHLQRLGRTAWGPFCSHQPGCTIGGVLNKSLLSYEENLSRLAKTMIPHQKY